MTFRCGSLLTHIHEVASRRLRPLSSSNLARRAGYAFSAHRQAETSVTPESLSAIAFALFFMQAAQVAAAPAVSATFNQYGFPNWYQDNSGIRVESCLSAADSQCVLGTFNPANPLAFPDNFPDEFFYSIVNAANMPTPGCDGTQPGRARVRFALEGAFANEIPAFNEQMVFGRVRITVDSGLCPNQTYTVNHPYGTSTITTDATGAVAANQGTVDIGCAPTPPLTTCDFSQALASPLLNAGLLRWDPSVGASATPGYLGGGPGETNKIIGGVNNFVAFIDSGNNQVLFTDQFDVSAKLAGPLLADTPKLDFGGVLTGTTSAQKIVKITNVWNTPLTISGVTTAGAAGTNFGMVTDGCTGSIAVDGTCEIKVTFTPSADGVRDATLQIAHSGLRSPFAVNLTGTGITNTQTPTLQAAPLAIQYGQVRIPTISSFRDVTITNTGTAPLQVAVALQNSSSGPGSDSAAFRIGTNTCANVSVPSGANCRVGVAFQPPEARSYTAKLTITPNAGVPVDVDLAATGIGGVAAVATSQDVTNGFPDWYRDDAGNQVGGCLDPTDTHCLVLTDDFYRGGPLVSFIDFPDPVDFNFPSEFFYYIAESDPLTTPGCGGDPGRAFVRVATEGAFANEGPVNGEQMVFGRVRFTGDGLCPNATYTMTYPYGEAQVTTDERGRMRRNVATTDIGCTPTPPQTCDYSAAIASPVFGSFLKQVNADPGYLGDPNTPANVTGATYVADGESTPANYFRIRGPGSPDGSSQIDLKMEQFTVSGKFNGPVSANPSAVAFGAVEVNTIASPREVTLINGGTTSIDVSPAVLTGSNAGAFELVDNNCDGSSIPAGGNCKVTVTFKPTTTGSQSATLHFPHTGRNVQTDVKLTGIGSAVTGNAAISLQPAALEFVDLQTGEKSASAIVHVFNEGGSAPLEIAQSNPITIGGTNASSFEFTSHCTDPVPVDGECTIDVRFKPGVTGVLNANLVIPNNAGPDVSVPLSGRGASGGVAQSSASTASGFPAWYRDANGIRLEPCLDPRDSNCVILGDATFNPANPVVFPTNFPMEFFYSIVESEILAIPADPSCPSGGGAGGSGTVRIALEGTFTTPQPQPGAQSVFGRKRIRITGLCANTTYTITTPWGSEQLTADGGGRINNTVDNAGVPGAAPLTLGFLRWDPNVTGGPSQPPAGYLGDAVTAHKIVGARRSADNPNAEPPNSFAVKGVGIDVHTDLFTVSGKLAGPVVTDVGTVDYGTIPINTTSTTKNVTVSNIGNTAITFSSPTASSGFEVFNHTCGTVQPNDTCTITTRFVPGSSTGAKTGTLTIAYAGARSPVTVGLSGTAIAAASPAMTVSTTTLNFPATLVGQTSTTQTITVTSAGSAALTLSAVNPAGTNANNFAVTGSCLPVPKTVQPANTCTVLVTFQPTGSGTRTATLTIQGANVPAATITLTGTGTAAAATLSPTSLTLTTSATGSTTKSITVNSTGTANLNLVNPTLVITSNVSADAGKFTASNVNCNNVAPGRKCTIDVRFAPNVARNTPRNTQYTATLTIKTNASNGATIGGVGGFFTVPLTGTIN